MRRLCMLLSLTLLSACGGDGGTGPPPPPANRAPQQPVISADTPHLVLIQGESVTLTANSSDPDGDALSFRWEVLSGGSTGSLNATTGSSVIWTAGSQVGDAEIQVIANDGELDSVRPDTHILRMATEIGGRTLSTDESWDLAGSPYVITGDIIVPAGQTLSLGARVELFFRPKSVFPDVEPSIFSIQGVLEIVGSPKGAGSVRLRGAMTEASVSPDKQWGGLAFESAEDITLSNLEITDAVEGIRNVGTGLLTISDSRVQNCQTGIVLKDVGQANTSEISVTHLRRVTVSSNDLDGIQLNSAVLDAEGCTITANEGHGLSAVAASDRADVNVRASTIANNVTANLRYDNNGNYFAYSISGCNIIPHFENNLNLNMAQAPVFCPLIGPWDITGNFWGVNAGDDVQVIKNLFSGNFCGFDFDSWVPNVDWLNSLIQLN